MTQQSLWEFDNFLNTCLFSETGSVSIFWQRNS